MSTSPPDRYGALGSVAKLKANSLDPLCIDPTGRYITARRQRALVIVDTEPDVPVEVAVHKNAAELWSFSALHPDGRTLAVRNLRAQRLEVRVMGSTKPSASRATETALTDWKGTPLPARAAAPQWGYGDEALWFSADGARLALATHQPDGRACVQLYDATTLDLIDTLTDLRLYGFYARADLGDAPFAPMTHWSESWLVQDPLSPGLVLGVRNAGDSALGVFGFRVEGDQITSVDPAALQRAVFNAYGDALRGLRLLPRGGLLVIDGDFGLTRLVWPPDVNAPIQARAPIAGHLRDESYQLVIPWHRGDVDDLIESQSLTVTPDHLLFNIDDKAQGRTVALVARDPVTLAPLGLVQRPTSRLRFGELLHLGGDLFAGVGAATMELFRLRR